MAVPCYIQVADVCNMFYKLPYYRRRYYATIPPSSCTQNSNAIRKTIQSAKQKSRSQNSGDFVFVLIFPYTISRNFFDESQSKLIVEFLTRNKKATILHNVISVSIFMRYLSTYLIIRHFCMFNMANCRLLLVFLVPIGQ